MAVLEHADTAGNAARRPDAGFLDDALAYAARDWPVLPCWGVEDGRCLCRRPGLRQAGEAPLGALVPHGVKDATTDPALIEAWWRQHPAANVGLAAGAAWWALDVDFAGFRTFERDGLDTLADLQRRFGRLPRTVHQRTGSLGFHWLFAPEPRIRTNSVKAFAGLDLRTGGGFIVAPPSRHVSGFTYRWIVAPDEAEPAPAPEWLVALLEPVAPPAPPMAARPVGTVDLGRYAEAALASAREKVAAAPPGTQEATLNSEAYGLGRLVGGGVIPRDTAKAGLVAAGVSMAPQAGRRPWTLPEVTWRVDRALDAGSGNPRTPEGRR